MMIILEPRFSSPRSLPFSFSPAVSLKPQSPWEPQALQGLLNGWRWTPFSDFGARANLETLLVRVRLGWGTGWHPEQKALQGLLLTREGDTGDWEAYCFLLFTDPVLENQLTQKEKMEQESLKWSIHHHYIQAAGGTGCQMLQGRSIPEAGSDQIVQGLVR